MLPARGTALERKDTSPRRIFRIQRTNRESPGHVAGIRIPPEQYRPVQSEKAVPDGFFVSKKCHCGNLVLNDSRKDSGHSQRRSKRNNRFRSVRLGLPLA